DRARVAGSADGPAPDRHGALGRRHVPGVERALADGRRSHRVIALLGWLCAATLGLLSLLAVYQGLLALASALPARAHRRFPGGERRRFLLLVPAHNEETGLAAALRSFAALAYPRDRVHIAVVA